MCTVEGIVQCFLSVTFTLLCHFDFQPCEYITNSKLKLWIINNYAKMEATYSTNPL